LKLPGKWNYHPRGNVVSHQLRIQVTRRSGAPFPGARCSVERAGALVARTTARAEIADEHGYAFFTIGTPARASLRITVAPPPPRTQLVSAPPWERNDTAFWPVSIDADYDPGGAELVWAALPLEVVRVDGAGEITEIEIRLLRVRNMDATVRRVLSSHVVAGASIDYPPVVPAAPAAAGPLPFLYTALNLLAGGVVDRVPVDRPPGDARRASLLEVAAREGTDGLEEPHFAPKCVGVWLPDEVAAMDRPPLLLYFRPAADQDFDGRWSGFEDLPGDAVTTSAYSLDRGGAAPYEKAAYSFEWFFRRSFEQVGDPWARVGHDGGDPQTPGPAGHVPHAVGLIDQIHASGKRLGVIAPVPEATLPNGGFGQAADPGFLGELVAEILEHVELRSFAARGEASPRRARAPGRLAAASFSSGSLVLGSFVSAVRQAGASSPLGGVLREIYVLDAPERFAAVVGEAESLLRGLAPPGDGALRVYGQNAYVLGPPFEDLCLALSPDPGAPADLTWERAPEPRPGLPHRTAAFLPAPAWPAAGAQRAEIHAFIPATMICHALRLSGFPDR